MALVDFILNCACLLLWLNWQSRRLSPMGGPSGIALVSTLKRAGPLKREHWYSLVTLIAILLLRAIAYSQMSGTLNWTPRLSLGAIVLHFRSDIFSRMLLFSLLGFLLFLLAFYFSLFLIGAANRRLPANDVWQSAVRAHLGSLNRLPSWILLLLPFVIAFLLWLGAAPALGRLDVLIAPKTFPRLAGEAALIGLGAWRVWQYALVGILALHVLSSYVYLGNAPFWNFMTSTARNFLRPFQWLPLRLGNLDLLPVGIIAIILVLGKFLPTWLAHLYSRLPMR